jgi:SAM-dependent methyltransferase
LTPKDFFIKLIWGNRLYNFLIRPWDRYAVEVIPSAKFSAEDIPLNKLCCLKDSRNPLWRKGFADLLFPPDENIFHRKVWEFCQTIYGLRKLKRLSPEAVALGIGCGHEELMYFLANRVKVVYATDLYEGAYLGGESAADVLAHPDKYAPFRYREDHLKVLRMDAGNLDFEDATFDIIFSLSSLEHFGKRKCQLVALKEMRRVLKPGGVVALTTELILNRLGRRRDYFRLETLLNIIRESGLILDKPLDLRVEHEYANLPLALPIELYRTPHVILRNFNTIYTSLSLFLKKAEAPAKEMNALTGDEVEKPAEPFAYRAGIGVLNPPTRVNCYQIVPLAVSIINEGNATWYRNGSLSHQVRIGVWMTASDGTNLSGEPTRFSLPKDVRPGEAVSISMDVPAFRKAGPVKIHIDLVKELCFWFREKGSPEKIVPIEIE